MNDCNMILLSLPCIAKFGYHMNVRIFAGLLKD